MEKVIIPHWDARARVFAVLSGAALIAFLGVICLLFFYITKQAMEASDKRQYFFLLLPSVLSLGWLVWLYSLMEICVKSFAIRLEDGVLYWTTVSRFFARTVHTRLCDIETVTMRGIPGRGVWLVLHMRDRRQRRLGHLLSVEDAVAVENMIWPEVSASR